MAHRILKMLQLPRLHTAQVALAVLVHHLPHHQQRLRSVAAVDGGCCVSCVIG